jgi:hypothetical protein
LLLLLLSSSVWCDAGLQNSPVLPLLLQLPVCCCINHTCNKALVKPRGPRSLLLLLLLLLVVCKWMWPVLLLLHLWAPHLTPCG